MAVIYDQKGDVEYYQPKKPEKRPPYLKRIVKAIFNK